MSPPIEVVKIEEARAHVLKGENRWPIRLTSARTQSVHARRRRNTAAPNAKRWKNGRMWIAGVATRDARAERTKLRSLDSLAQCTKIQICCFEGSTMRRFGPLFASLALVVVGGLAGCSQPAAKSPDVADGIRKSLDESNLKDVSVTQDRDKGVVRLGGHVASDSDKARAESLAKAQAAGQVVANEVAVTPAGVESDAKAVNSNLDDGIKSNVDAALIGNKLNKIVRRDVKNGVVTLKGEVGTQAAREQAEKIVAGVPNVQQVVNELQVKEQKATSRK
jgi:osmotically-inducible protein OsmY